MPEPERELQDRPRDRVWDRTRLAAELARASPTAAPRPGRRGCRCRAARARARATIASATSWYVDQLHHRIEAEQHRRSLDPQVVRRRVVHRPDDVHRPQDHRLDALRAPQERRHQVIDLDQIAHLREPLRGEQRRVLGEELRVVGARAVDVRATTAARPSARDTPGSTRAASSCRRCSTSRARRARARGSCITPRWIERVDVAGAEHVARLLAAQIDLVVLDVLRPARHRPAIEPDDLPAEHRGGAGARRSGRAGPRCR